MIIPASSPSVRCLGLAAIPLRRSSLSLPLREDTLALPPKFRTHLRDSASNKYVDDAKKYLATGRPSIRYNVWFGNYDLNRLKTVQRNFDLIGNDATSATYDCSRCRNNPKMDYQAAYAYVESSRPGTVRVTLYSETRQWLIL